MTGSPDRVAVEGGVFRAELCPGPCVVTLLSMGVSGRLCAACGARFRCEFAGGF